MVLSRGSFFGRKKNIRRLDKYLITVCLHNGFENLPKHVHMAPYASILLKGKYLERKNSQFSSDLELDSKWIIFRPAGYEHSNQFGKTQSVCFNIEFNDLKIRKDQPYNSFINEFGLFRSTIELVKLVNGFFQDFPDDEMNCLVEESLASLLSIESAATSSYIVKNCIEYIYEHFQTPISLKDVASHLRVHPIYLARSFKNKMNITVGEFIRSTRLTRGYMSLCQSNDSLTKIGNSLGFYDQSHFTRSFRNEFGGNPSSVRKNFG